MRYFFLITLLFFYSNSIFSNYDMNANMQLAYSQIINLNFDDAIDILENEKIQNPNNAFIILNENYIDFLKIIIGEDKLYYENNRIKKNARLNNLKKISDESPYQLLIQAEIQLQWAFTRIKFKQYFLAAYELQKAYTLLKKNEELYPDFFLNKKNLGILKILIGSIPDEYSWILNIIGLEGNVNNGFDDLYQLLNICKNNESYNIYKSEILFYLSFLEMNMRNNDEYQINLLNEIENCCYNNNLMLFCAARLSSRLGDNEQTIKILEKRTFNKSQFDFHYLDYLYAMSKFYQQDYVTAQEYFLRYTSNFNGTNYIKSANHKLFLISLLTDSSDNVSKYRNLVLEKGDALIDEDLQALRDIKNNKKINIELLNSRILFDGGYYQQAYSSLEKLDADNLNDNSDFLIEYYYRKARVSQKLKKPKEIVISLFLQVLKQQDNSNLYYHPMSTLQIAFEYEKGGNIKEAINYLNKVFNYENYNYENGIKKSAQSALNRLEINTSVQE